ncbi:14204_t:CDS:2 [Gigaspora margarita]|uniref:14204_t:CDS:1 n=1 Tax=Gigaspora margarita TaxID=4874 RepID=A0ABN7UXQ5_GIGMA|nr:14204_t:CDS:2 [Gigaspora margarita]
MGCKEYLNYWKSIENIVFIVAKKQVLQEIQKDKGEKEIQRALFAITESKKQDLRFNIIWGLFPQDQGPSRVNSLSNAVQNEVLENSIVTN